MRSHFELASTAGLIFLLYFVTFGYNGEPQTGTVYRREDNRVDSHTIQLTCNPVPERIISPLAGYGREGGHLLMLPRPKHLEYVRSNNHHLGIEESIGVLSYDHSLLVDISMNMNREHIQLDEEVVHFEANRLCIQSRTLSISSSGDSKPVTVNGSRVIFIQKVEVFIMSLDSFSLSLGNESRQSVDVDSAYTIDVSINGIVVHTASIEGLRLAFSSLAQIMENPSVVRTPLRITDWASNRWRGLMLDVARHFIPVRKIYRILDAMHAVKLNYLHLHLTDSQVGAI